MSGSGRTPSSAAWSTDVWLPGSRRHGRAFLTANLVGHVSTNELQAFAANCFVEEDDEPRMPLLEKALEAPTVTVETYPGESPPVEYHAYIRSPQVSDAPIFACVLASSAVLEHLLSKHPHVVVETATFQVVGDPFTHSSIVAAMEEWVSRVWPGRAIPRIFLSPWPGPVETKQTTIDIMRHFKGVPSLPDDGGAPREFSPPDGLVAPQFRLSEDAA